MGKQLIYSTEHGIGVLNTTDDSFRNVEFSHDFPLIGINRGCGLFAVGNTILVGGTNGMVAMDVSRLLATRTYGRLYFSRLYINGKECLPGDGTDIEKVKIKVSTSQANYLRDLPLHESQQETEGDVEKLTLKLKVSPPFYLSTLAYIIYIAIFFSLICAFYYFKRSQLLLETSLAIEKKDRQNEEALSKAKLQFFTSISHAAHAHHCQARLCDAECTEEHRYSPKLEECQSECEHDARTRQRIARLPQDGAGLYPSECGQARPRGVCQGHHDGV